MRLIEIDGSTGEGGGQVLRSSITLAVITGQAVRLRNIRGGRRKPGLMRQHLTAVKAAAETCGGRVTGATLRSGEVEFRPGQVKGGRYHFSVGTAGSACLVLQTVLVPLLLADAPSELILEGGTHNPFAPPYDFLAETFFPLLGRMGARFECRLVQPGFYPAGGGRIEVNIEPAGSLSSIDVLDRGKTRSVAATVVLANLPESIAAAETRYLKRELRLEDAQCSVQRINDGPGPGNAILVRVVNEAHTEVFCGFGQRGVSASKVVGDLAKSVRQYLDSTGPVGVHLADQLIIPLAVAGGGSFRTVGISAHTSTNISIVEQFLDVTISREREKRGNTLVSIEPARS